MSKLTFTEQWIVDRLKEKPACSKNELIECLPRSNDERALIIHISSIRKAGIKVYTLSGFGYTLRKPQILGTMQQKAASFLQEPRSMKELIQYLWPEEYAVSNPSNSASVMLSRLRSQGAIIEKTGVRPKRFQITGFK
ncbi:MAG: hypothetical protein AAGD25_06315 [Cyanobacteria bacterium P01_F01_bin.150]